MPSAPIALRVLAWRLRPWLWTAFVVLAAWMLVQRVTSPPVGLPVVVTAHAVPPGEVLEAGDLRVASVPRSLVPDGVVTDPSALVGRAPTVALPAGLPVVDALLEGSRFTLDPPANSSVVSVTVSSGELLAPGDQVELVEPGSSGAWSADPAAEQTAPVVLAHGALVLDVGTHDDGSGTLGASLDGSTPTQTAVVVAVTPEEGRRIAAISSDSPLGAVLMG